MDALPTLRLPRYLSLSTSLTRAYTHTHTVRGQTGSFTSTHAHRRRAAAPTPRRSHAGDACRTTPPATRRTRGRHAAHPYGQAPSPGPPSPAAPLPAHVGSQGPGPPRPPHLPAARGEGARRPAPWSGRPQPPSRASAAAALPAAACALPAAPSGAGSSPRAGRPAGWRASGRARGAGRRRRDPGPGSPGRAAHRPPPRPAAPDCAGSAGSTPPAPAVPPPPPGAATATATAAGRTRGPRPSGLAAGASPARALPRARMGSWVTLGNLVNLSALFPPGKIVSIKAEGARGARARGNPTLYSLLPSHASDSAQGPVSLEAGFRVSPLVREIEGSQVFQRQRFRWPEIFVRDPANMC